MIKSDNKSNNLSVITPIVGHFGLYLYFSRYLDPIMIYNLKSVKKAVNDYSVAKKSSEESRITFTMVFLSVALILLLLAIWLGMAFANSLIDPISSLIGASESVKNLNKETGSLIENVISLENSSGKTILIIDDDPTVSELMKRQLSKEGYQVIIAPNGKDGIRLARELKPDAITLDILMPEMDGWSVLRTLKADPEVSNIPVIMASILDEKNKGFSLGAADFLSKPIQKEYLMKSIRNLTGDKENLKICIIEDDESLRFTIKEILEKQNVEIIEAENGKVGMSLLHKQEIKPDLILLDLMMPVMNGFEFLKSIRETDLNSIPILVLTGADLSEDEKSFLSGEVQRILEKSEDTLSSIVSEVGNVIKASSKEGGVK